MTPIASAWAKPAGSLETVRIGIIGCGWKGLSHIETFDALPQCRVVALSDPDESRMQEGLTKLEPGRPPARTYRDFRELLEQPDIDAVVIVTPNHWHALMAVLACEAGKHVFLEKPLTRTWNEASLILQAAQRTGRMIQGGAQGRSDVGFNAALEFIKSQEFGRPQWAHGFWYRTREPIGKVTGPQSIPANVDYNLWTGPAPLKPLMRERFHYDWHWQWDYGNGEMGNLGTHQADEIVYALGLEELPTRAMSLGGRFLWNDDGQTANMHLALLDFQGLPFLLEVRDLPDRTGVSHPASQYGRRSGNRIQYEGGYILGGRGGADVYDAEGNRIQRFPGDAGGSHQANFIEAIRQDHPSILASPIENAILSTQLTNLANLSYLAGRLATTPEIKSATAPMGQAQPSVDAFLDHLGRLGIHPDQQPITLGPWVKPKGLHSLPMTGDSSLDLLLQERSQVRARAPFNFPA